ncbi:MAG: RHS repeat protein, partial [Candidatus Accumulibacter sp.]|nr:RHS repeat protein [Accumulibacter sp.]
AISGLTVLILSDAGSLLDVSRITDISGREFKTINGAVWTFPVGWQAAWGSGNTLSTSGVGSAFINRSTISLPGSELAINTSDFTNAGVLSPVAGGVFDINGSFRVDELGVLTGVGGGTFAISGDLLGDTRNADRYVPEAVVRFDGLGTSTDPQRLEVMGRDVGADPDGFSQNFVYTTLDLANGTYLQLVDLSDNAAGAGSEAVYVNSLIVPTGTTLDLAGLHLYTRAAQIGGTIVGGSIDQIPDSGPLKVGSPTPGAISVAGELDEWSFFARAGRSIKVAVDTGGSAVLSPMLNWAHVELVDSNDTVLASAGSGGPGETVVLDEVAIAADGVLRVRIKAPASQIAARGNYVVSVWDVTADVSSLLLNKQVTGQIENPYSIDKWQFSATAGTQIRFDLINASSASIAFDLAGPAGWTGFSDITVDSPLITLPTAGTYTVTAYGSGGYSGGSYAFSVERTQVTDLALGTFHTGQFVGSGQAELFRIEVPASSPLKVDLDDDAPNNVNELFLKFGAPPTRGDYDYRFSAATAPDQQVLVPMAYAGRWYALVYGNTTRTPGSFSISAAASDINVVSVTPDHHARNADSVLTITGAGFDANTSIELISFDGTPYAATRVEIDSSTRITATLGAHSIPVDASHAYSIRVSKPGAVAAILPDAFRMLGDGTAHLETNVVVPSTVGYHQPATIYINYANTGDVAMPAPLLELDVDQDGRQGAILTLDSSRLPQGFWAATVPDGFSHYIQILGSGATPGVLQPGESISVPVYYAGWQQPWDFSYQPINYNLHVIDADSTGIFDWQSLKDGMKPFGLTTQQWEPIFQNLAAEVGGTWGDYVKMLDENATYMGRLGESVGDVEKLLSLESLQASGLTNIQTLVRATDANVQAPGLALDFTRSFGTYLPEHFRSGRFGWGWSDNWDWRLSVANNVPNQPILPGTVTIAAPAGVNRVFQPDSRSGSYFAQSGDFASLISLGAGMYELQETDGTAYRFRADGALDFVQDTHGNRITCLYNNGLLTELDHSSGFSLRLSYTAEGLVSSIADSFGRVSSFTYDAAAQHLLSAANYRGQTQTYEYSIGNGLAREHALTEITDTDGTETSYTYDTNGRLISETAGCSCSGGSAGSTTSYAYDSTGTVTSTDALGEATRRNFDWRGRLVRTVDALGNAKIQMYDNDSQTIANTDAAGRMQRYVYDARGNLVRWTDSNGSTTNYSYTTS